ncbi:unnamed protein product [Meloidogyne enterolobii]|uniref:Uncharacterized protein n=1 Tax=Meloidogyne enterolobii TaxID=390850 RepID=A0ACB0Y4C6_MELEN
MLDRRLHPLEFDTGPGTRKSSTLCSLLLLLVIATFLVCKVPGQMKEEFVGVANHKKIEDKVTLVNFTIEANETNFNSDENRKRFPNACDVKIDSKTIELQYNNITGCTVDLLVKNTDYNNKIKFKAGVRKREGELKDCLDAGVSVQNSFNNIMPFVYSKNNKVVERLGYGPIYAHKESCKNREACGMCRRWTTLEISWSKFGGDVYAYTHLGKIIYIIVRIFVFLVGEIESSNKLSIAHGGKDEIIFNMEIESGGKFTVNFAEEKTDYNSVDDITICVPKNKPFVAPEAWTITKGDLKDKLLLVFSLLPLSASVVSDGTSLFDKSARSKCGLFVQFDRNDYELLFVSLPPQTTTTTTTTQKISSTDPETPVTSIYATSPTTTPVITTTTAKNISTPALKCPAESKCPKESNGWLFYLILVAAIVGIIIIGILAWFTRSWMKVNSAKLKEIKRERKEEEDVLALYKTEAKLIKNIKPFEEWKEDKKLEDQRAGLCSVPTEKLVGTLWKRIEKENAKDKMQFLADQFDKQKDKELNDREYALELTEKGYDAVGSFKEWKTENNIKPFEVIDGTSTAIEYGESRIIDKPLLPGASIDDKKRY